MGELEKGRLRHARVEARSAFQEDRGTYDRLRRNLSGDVGSLSRIRDFFSHFESEL